MATATRTAPSKNGHGSSTSRVSAQPRLGQAGPELQRFGTLRQLPIALPARARTESCRILVLEKATEERIAAVREKKRTKPRKVIIE